MTEEQIKEMIGYAYVNAVAARAGMTVTKPNADYGIDGTINDIQYDSVTKRYFANGFGIDFQLKSSTDVITTESMIKYDLEVRNYRDLICEKVGAPRILILYEMPKDKDTWIEICENETMLRKCAWWCSLKGLPNVENSKTKRVEIPKENIFTVENLQCLMQKVREGRAL